MENQSPKHFVPPLFAFVILVPVLLGGVLLMMSRTATTVRTMASNSTCSLPSVKAAMNPALSLDPASRMKDFLVPAGKPSKYATVNGQVIWGYDVEARLNQRLALDKVNSSQIDSGKSMDQLRRDIINSMIDDDLLLQDAVHLGLVPAPASVEAQAQQQIKTFETMPTGSSAWAQFDAYLCENNLSISNYSMDPRVLSGYSNAMMIAADKNQQFAGLTNQQLHDPSLLQARIYTHLQALQTKAVIVIFYPSP